MENDLISREEALDTLLFAMSGTGYQQRARDAIRMMPSVDAPVIVWHSVKDMMPDNEKPVLLTVCRRNRDHPDRCIRFVVNGFYTDGMHNTRHSGYRWSNLYYDDLKYDEAEDAYIIPDGWWESTDDSDECNAVRGEVTHWADMPEACMEVT